MKMKNLVLILVFPALACADFVDVHINAHDGESGKGLAVTRGLDCYVITAKHVVQSPLPVTVTGADRRQSPATVEFRSNNHDLALLKITHGSQICTPDSFVDIQTAISQVIPGAVWQLRFRGEDGAVDSADLAINTINNGGFSGILIDKGNFTLGQRLSGSMLYANGIPLGMLYGVNLQRQLTRSGVEQTATGNFYRIDTIQEVLGNRVALSAPEIDRAKYNDQHASELLLKNTNYVQTQEFCYRLWKYAKHVAKPEVNLDYDRQHTGYSGDVEYVIDSLLIPGTDSVWTPGRRRTLNTTIAIVPGTTRFDQAWQPIENAIDRCIKSDIKKEIGKIRVRTYLHRDDVGKRTMWTLQRTGWAGMSMEQVEIWLSKDSLGITLRMWSYD